jgi:N4-(beta-N-acetylglucosaminyl)-L-asparaginase
MRRRMSRRDFVKTGAVAGTTLAAAKNIQAQPRAPTVLTPSIAKPVVIASANGNKFKNGGARSCVAEAFARMTKGADLLDSLVAGVNIVELDPEDTSVGYGGLPNADGVVQLDASCMHGPKKRAGGVAALEGVRTPSLVAKAVMDQTDHHLLVGAGAQAFARGMGFHVEPDLNTEKSRRLWLEWKRKIDPAHFLDPAKRTDATDAARGQMVAEGLLDPLKIYGTINANGLGLRGEMCGVTTTSGLAFKIPGRVGDSPILGAGLWVDDEVGAAGSTGRGEANLYGLCSFLIVEMMRQGKHPKDAAVEALRRIQTKTVEKRLLNSKGLPNFQVTFYALNKKGDFAGVSLYPFANNEQMQFSVCTEHGPELRPCDGLFGEMPKE